MGDESKPRHIKDIAHLYLSRMEQRREAPPITLLVAADTKNAFSSLHTANLAAGLSSPSEE